MADTTTTLKLRAIDDGAIATVNNVSAAFTGLTIGTTVLALGFKGLQKASESSVSQFILGTQNAEKFGGAIAKLADVNSKALKSFSALSDITFIGSQVLTAVKGIQDAASVYARIPQTFELFRSSGVSTQSIEDFYTLTDAVRGSEASLDAFAISAVQNLGRFEQAAARAGTILKSSINFDAGGNALRASQKEQLDNAFQVQDIVNNQLNNTVSSTSALLGQYEVLSSGFAKAADSQQVLAAGLKLTSIGQAGGVATDPGETLRLLGKTLNAYQLSATDASKAAAVLNAIVENGITTVPELSQGFGQTATTARAAGIALNDLAAGTAVLTTQGINTATALTGLQRVAGSIIQKTPEAQKALDKLSLNGQKIRFDQAEVQAKGFTQALLDLNTAAGGNVKTLQEIFPEEVAFRTVLALLAQDGQKLASVLNSVSSVGASSLDDVFKLATSDRVNKFQQIANKFQELIIKVAASVAPVFEPGIAVLERIANFFSGLPEPIKQAIGQFIVFQISTRATASAVTILFQTMLTLASTYLQVRAISLLLSGQLGKELAVIRELITQRKGLVAVALQLFGIDQRFRLGVEATTEAIGKQNVVTKAATAIRNKAGEVFNQNVASFTGLDLGQAKEQGKQAVAEVAQTAKNVGRGIAEAVGAVPASRILGADGKPIVSGLGRVKQEAAKVGEAIASGFESIKSVDAGAAVTTAYENVKQSATKATAAITGQIPATAAATAVTAAHTVVLTSDELAEKGLAQTRIFGRNVLFGTTGPLGALNTLLATEISLKTIGVSATRSLATAQGLLTGSSNLLSTVVKSGLVGSFNLLKGGVGTLGNALSGLLGTLGPVGPLLAVGGLAVAIFKEDLFGLKKAADEAASSLQEILKSDADLSKKFGADQRLLQFKAEIKPDASATNIETRLEQLRLSGDLTTSQFNQLRQTLAQTGEQGKLTALGLEQFKSQLEAIRQGAIGTPEKGVGDRVGDFFGGLGSGIIGAPEYFGNLFAAAAFRPQEFFNVTTLGQSSDEAVATIYRERESDRLIKNNSQIQQAQVIVGDQSLATAEKINQYRKALGLTTETNEKIRIGTKLTAEDLEREQQLFEQQKSRNENLISGIDKNLAEQRKLLEGIKDAENRELFENQINLLEKERSTLEKRNEALKNSREEFAKYYAEILPGLKRAITESTNLQQSLDNTQSSFGQQFKLDAQGKATPFLKDISTLRAEAQQYQSQILESYQGGLFEQLSGPVLPGRAVFAPEGVAEAQVAQRLRDVRDNQIKLPDGTQGFRLSVSDRIAATQQIIEVEQTASKGRGEALKLEAEKIKLQQQQKVIGTEEAEKRIAQIQLQGVQETLKQKEIEIKEYAKFPVRKVQLERDAAAIRVLIEQTVTSEENRQIEKRRNLRQEAFNVEVELVKSKQAERGISEREAQAQVSQIQIKASRDRFNNLVEDFNKSGDKELSNKIAISRAQLRQQEAAENERLFNLEQERQKRVTANSTSGKTLALQRQSSGIDSRSSDIEQRQQLLSSAAQLQSIFSSATESQLQNQLKFTGDLEKRAAIETQIAENKLKNLGAIQQQEQVSLTTQTQINRLNLDREAIQLRIQKIENQRQLAELDIELTRAKRDRRSPEEIAAIELQIKGAQQQSGLLEEQATRLDRSKVQQAQIAKNTERELGIKQGIARTEAEIEITQARRRKIEAQEERQKRVTANSTSGKTLALQRQSSGIDSRSSDIEQRQQLLSSAAQLQSIFSSATESQLQNQLKFTGDLEKRAAIETQIAENKLKNLGAIQQQEQVSLTTQTQINRLNLDREAIQLRIQKIENQRQLAELDIELTRAKRDRRSPEEIAAVELQIKGAQQQSGLLEEQATRLDRSKVQQAQIAKNTERELGIKQGIARTEAEIEITQARRRKIEALLEKQIKSIELASTRINIAGQIQIQQSEAVAKAYDKQKSVLQASQNFIKGRIDFVTSELQLASELSSTEADKKEIAQAIAAIKLQSLQKQLSIEEQVLNLNIAQQAAQLEQEKIRNRISQSQSKVSIAQAQADLAKAKLDPLATSNTIKVAELNLQAKLEEAVSIGFAGKLLEQQGQIQSTLNNFERQSFRDQKILQIDQARIQYARAIEDPELLEKLRQQSLGRAFGVQKQDASLATSAFLRQSQYQFGEGRPLEPIEQYYASFINNRINPQTPSLQLQFPDFEQYRNNQLARFQEFGYNFPNKLSSQDMNTLGQAEIIEAVTKLNALVDQKLSRPNEASISVSITNNFSSNEAARAADTITTQLRKELYDIGMLLNR